MRDPRRPSKAKAQVVWSSLTEHVIKVTLYSLFAMHALISSQRSRTTFSYTINAFIGIFTLSLVKGEVDLIIKRLQRKLPPGYLGFPVYREIQFFRTVSNGGILQRLDRARCKYGTLFTRSFLGRIIIALGGQADLSWLFSNDRKALTEVSWPPNIVMLLGNGSVANQMGKYHRVLRRLLEPCFAPKFVTNYLRIIDETTQLELERWASSGTFQKAEVFQIYALRLIYAASFGRIDDNVVTSLHADFKQWLGGFMSIITTTKIPGTAIARAMKARQRIHGKLDKLIDEFIKENPEKSDRAQITTIGRMIYGRDKDNNRMMTRDEIKDNLLTLIFAGHDTTCASISTLLYHVSQNPDAMEALAEEASTLSEPLKSDELKNAAPVINACIHEAWRMDPPVMGGFRKAVKEIQHSGYSFEEGTVFNYSVLMATTDESLYKNHGKFNMRRFLPKYHPLYLAGEDSGIDPLQGKTDYPIFGGGTHACLGKAFAQLELRILATRMMKHYKLEVRNPQKIFFPVNGWDIEFKLTSREDVKFSG